ncbi:MAG: MFS transporter [Actinomycetota bacterium]|nr:MFS transporter [Actinomycetota bacterium]
MPILPVSAWVLAGATSASGLGAGLVFPFLVLYLAEIRGLGAAVGGAVFSVGAATTFAVSFPGGWLADRFGVRRVYVLGRLLKAISSLVLAPAATPAVALAGGVLFGLGQAATFTTLQSLLAISVPAEQRSVVFAVRHAGANLGFGLGAVAGGLIVDLDEPASFIAVLVLSAASEVVGAVAVLAAVPAERIPVESRTGGYGVLLRDPALLRLLAIDVVLLTVTAGQFDVVIPLAAVRLLGLGAGVVGFLMGFNTLVVVFSSLVVARLIVGPQRTRALALSAALGALAWTLLLVADAAPLGVVALLFAMGTAQAVGESIEVPSVAGMVNDLAPDALRARYNAGHGLSFATATAVGPAIAGLAAEMGALRGLLIGLAVTCGLVALAALTLKDPDSSSAQAALRRRR